jgi:SAM-dependent methyltransferase
MWKMRYYLPLFGFVVPTVVVGYGFVIPRSCIAGVNALTLGFASTIIGSTLTYVAGIRSATRTACPASMPWRVRLNRYINRQAAMPHGLFGRFLGFIWPMEHRGVNQVTLELLGIERGHDVLEVGCGSGAALQRAAAQASDGHVLGLDVSETMVRAASSRNRGGIANGRVAVRAVDGTDLQLTPGSFDRIFSVHSIYFWQEPQRVFGQLADGLRPNGRLVLAFRPEGPDVPTRFRDPVYRFYSAEQVKAMLVEAGLEDVQSHSNGALRWLVASARLLPRPSSPR